MPSTQGTPDHPTNWNDTMTTRKTAITLDEKLFSLLEKSRGPVNRSAFIAGVLHKHFESDERRMRTQNY